ncbi:hypothetical protein FPSE_06377 [Fusarium pseudograminearum CS3096]|uniref:Methyltransferase type 11 domain-containing protein n=1 Tax=Fusarium pseudograminearum (strain CS3096) TaxID=1028729 RepID=K3VH32_FUSPC|nr:hypothetical protein FPSE_06377 [Fusarium pseudograminearum CS3096]EKJ73459.1 hypothetical protein FPSE_06377 [Fusarium pseudograminearum CS3096]
MTIKEDQQLSNSEYLDSRYVASNGDDPIHEWFRSFEHLQPFLGKNLLEQPGRAAQDNPKVLHLGSGDSVVPAELAGRGYKDQLCDIAGIEWKRVDVRDMPTVSTGSIDVAFDKGTLDAMIYGSPWSPPDEVKENTSRYLKEVHRALKDDGVFLYITFRQPHFMKLLLNPDNIWNMEMEVLGDGGTFDYYGYVIRKSKPQ